MAQEIHAGISVYTEWDLYGMSSTLTLATVKESDSGRYECTVDGIGTDLVTLEVVKGKAI